MMHALMIKCNNKYILVVIEYCIAFFISLENFEFYATNGSFG